MVEFNIIHLELHSAAQETKNSWKPYFPHVRVISIILTIMMLIFVVPWKLFLTDIDLVFHALQASLQLHENKISQETPHLWDLRQRNQFHSNLETSSFHSSGRCYEVWQGRIDIPCLLQNETQQTSILSDRQYVPTGAIVV